MSFEKKKVEDNSLRLYDSMWKVLGAKTFLFYEKNMRKYAHNFVKSTKLSRT